VKKILIVRTDRLGDAILTTPVACALKKNYPDSNIVFWARDYTREAIEQCTCVDGVITFPETMNLIEMAKKLKKERFDSAILVHPEFKLALTLFLARIPVRIGTGYRIYSFLLSRRLYEHRKYSTRHEVEYNLNLLKLLGFEEKQPEFSFTVPESARQSMVHMLANMGLEQGKYSAAIHPGSGGSAPGWSADNFSKLADRLTASGVQVIITGGPGDKEIVDQVVRECLQKPYTLPRLLSLTEFMAVLKNVDLFVSNSTGPLHLARALGTDVIGMYPPLITASALRWGPYGKQEQVFTPDVPACKKCTGEHCHYYDCMNSITVKSVFDKIDSMIKRKIQREK